MRTVGLLTLTVIATLTFSQNSSAVDRKIYTALGCRAYNDTTPTLTYGTTGRAKNTGSEDLEMVCPIIRDTSIDTVAVTLWKMAVDRNGNIDENWFISIYSANEYGTSYSGYIGTVEVPHEDGGQYVGWPTSAPDWPLVAYNEYGTLYIRSAVPHDAEIRGYQVGEPDES